ncbi:MAG: Hsp70 family protein, partial [Actinophytocola sp.]|uniref:Hsp70 family protein n=1 Tax=Actinophytocola sp. TaxID=1872138 RepID=UPI003C761240
LSLVPEPVAVAARAGLPAGAAVLVVDLGGGTCDAAVVRRDGTGYAVLACAGLPDLGGDDLDQRIIDHLRPGGQESGSRAELLLRQDARAAKELLSRHESAQLSMPGTDPVTLDRGDFEVLVDADLARMVELAGRVVESAGVAPADLRGVHLVGGTSRIPMVTALLRSALALPVHPDPEPESGVAWGAVELVADHDSDAPTRPAPSTMAPLVHSGLDRPRRSRGLLAACVAVAAVAAMTAVVLLTGNPGVRGNPVAARESAPSSTAEDAVAAFPPVLPGTPVVGAGEPSPIVVPPGGTGVFQATGTYEGATETRVAVRLDQGAVADRAAPSGYRWVVASVVATLLVEGELPYGDGHNVFLRDDRGQLVESVNRAGKVTEELCGSDQQNLPAAPTGIERTECAVFLVPVATSVRGVVYDERGSDKLGAHAVLFPVDLPATGPSALPAGDGRVGGPAVEVSTGDAFAEVAVADVIDTPSAYLADPKPPPGTRLHVVRFTVRASGVATVRLSQVSDALHVLDDRGVLIPIDGFIGYEQRECQELPEELAAGATAKGCVVFGLSQHTTIGRVVFQAWDASGDPTRWQVWEPSN